MPNKIIYSNFWILITILTLVAAKVTNDSYLTVGHPCGKIPKDNMPSSIQAANCCNRLCEEVFGYDDDQSTSFTLFETAEAKSRFTDKANWVINCEDINKTHSGDVYAVRKPCGQVVDYGPNNERQLLQGSNIFPEKSSKNAADLMNSNLQNFLLICVVLLYFM